MRILAVYGFHKEEREFGRFVCDEYNRRYSPDNSLLVTRSINNSAHQRDKTQEQVEYQEICDLINQYQPDVFIDIHHNNGITSDMRQQLNSFQSPPKPKKKGRLASFLDRLMGLSLPSGGHLTHGFILES